MGVYTLEEFVGKIGELMAAELQVAREGTALAVPVVEASIRATSPSVLRGYHGRGSGTLGLRHVIHGEEAEIIGIGPWALIERNTRPHGEPKALDGVVVTPYGVFSHVQHPGTQGKHVFQRGSEISVPAVERVYGELNEATLGRVL